MELGLKDKTALKGKANPVRRIVRCLNVFAPNTKSTPAFPCPSPGKKVCLLFFEHLHDPGRLPNRHVRGTVQRVPQSLVGEPPKNGTENVWDTRGRMGGPHS